ncbi:MAG TPA: hypothetical protein DDW52_00940 [Planctomycetaceae bacterium]|nr:hypothetical protein [Planctomycetaceae bacterium]
MTEIPKTISTLVDQHLSTGKYASREDVMETALNQLDTTTLSILQASVADEQAGHSRSILEVAQQLKEQLGYSTTGLGSGSGIQLTATAEQAINELASYFATRRPDVAQNWFEGLILHLEVLAVTGQRLPLSPQSAILGRPIRKVQYQPNSHSSQSIWFLTTEQGMSILHLQFEDNVEHSGDVV